LEGTGNRLSVRGPPFEQECEDHHLCYFSQRKQVTVVTISVISARVVAVGILGDICVKLRRIKAHAARILEGTPLPLNHSHDRARRLGLGSEAGAGQVAEPTRGLLGICQVKRDIRLLACSVVIRVVC
jgi:hypothetical protein